MTPTNDSISKPPLKRLSSATDDDESPRKRPKLEDAVADELHQIEVAHAGSASTHSDSDEGYFPSNMTTPRTIQNSIKRALDTADTDTDQSPRKRLKQTVSDAKPPITDATGWTGISSSHKSKEGTEEDAFAPAQPMPRSMKTEDSDEAIVLNSHPLITSDSPPVSQYVATVHPSSIPSINLLPPEILANIFSFHAFNAPLGYDPDEYDEDIDEITDPDYLANETESDSYFPDKLGWARVTHVCQKWRYVALDDARLWSTVVVDLPGEFLEEILQRSKGALLDLTIPLASQFRVIEPILKENMHRVRSLTLDNLSNEVASLLALPAPQLEELELPFGLEDRYMIPTPFLANNAPCLKRLTVAESIDFPWDSPVLDHLVELTIDRSTSQMRACAFPAPNAFFDLIGRLDRIQTLALRSRR
ncbi:hypothetical protein OF83DRAFT_1179580 [Amylostereum chailletii]|nr:hypothetical protein OF83DRAFT_1179580 [Amylostereum chailletii]